MAQTSSRTPIHSSKLIRFLTDLDLAEVEASPQHFAERLGQLFDFSDALILSSALEESVPSNLSSTVIDGESALRDAASLKEGFLLARRNLVNSVIKSCSPTEGATRIKLPAIKTSATVTYEPYRRFYLAHQQDIDGRTRHLRTNVRNALSHASPALSQLANLDATLDDILWERSRKLFSTIPTLLEKRFEHWRNTHSKTLGDSQHVDDPARWMLPDQWLGRYCSEMQSLLLAEVDIQLQPVLGLVEAFNNEVHRKQ